MSRLEIAHHEWHRPPGARHPFLEIVPAGTDVPRLRRAPQRRPLELDRAAARARAARPAGGIERHQARLPRTRRRLQHARPGRAARLRAAAAHGSGALVWLSGGRIRWQTIQMLLDAGYVDGYRLLHPGDPGFTFPTWDPHIRLDYVFLPEPFAGRLTSCEVVRGTPRPRRPRTISRSSRTSKSGPAPTRACNRAGGAWRRRGRRRRRRGAKCARRPRG